MKKIFTTLMVAAAFLAASCSKMEEPRPEASAPVELKQMTFTASFDAETKTNYTSGNLAWAKGDRIVVYSADGTTSEVYVVPDDDHNKSSIEFTATVGAAPYYAIACRDKTKYSFDSASQKLSEYHMPAATGAWSSGDALVASTNGSSFSFKHTTGWINFQTAKTVKNVRLGGSSLCFGNAVASFPEIGGTPSIESVGVHCDTLMVRARTDYYFPILPGTYDSFNITLKTSDSAFGIDIPNMQIKRGTVLKLGNIDARLTEYAFYESFSGCISLGGNTNEGGIPFGTAQLSGSGSVIAQDNTGWDLTKGCAGKSCMYFGTSSAQGIAITPALGVVGTATIKFKASPWDNSTDKTKKLQLSVVGNGTLSQTEINFNSVVGWKEYTITLTGADAETKIKFAGQAASKSRFWLDEIRVIGEGAPAEPVTGPHYEKVTAQLADWSGRYLMVAPNAAGDGFRVVSTPFQNVGSKGDNAYAFCTDEVTVVDDKIAQTSTLAGYEFTIEKSGITDGDYAGSYLVSYGGKYLQIDAGQYYFNLLNSASDGDDYKYWSVTYNAAAVGTKILAGTVSITNIKQGTRTIHYHKAYAETAGPVRALAPGSTFVIDDCLYKYVSE